MKRNIVIRLLAAALAATLVVTGVPNSALTGIETVYASAATFTLSSENVKATDTTITVTASAANYSVIALEAGQKIADITAGDSKWVSLTQVNETQVYQGKIEDLAPDTTYTLYYKENTTISTTGGYSVTTEKTDISEAKITLSAESAVYTGSKITPTVTKIELGGTSLGLSDFDISYENNTNVAAYDASENAPTVIVTPKASSSYDTTKTAKKTFSITALELTDGNAGFTIDGSSESDKTYTYTGTEITPKIKVTLTEGSKELGADDYTVTYTNGNTSDGESGDGGHKLPGTVTVTITGKGNYSGTLTTQTFTIAAQEKADTPSKPDVTGADSQKITINTKNNKAGYTYKYIAVEKAEAPNEDTVPKLNEGTWTSWTEGDSVAISGLTNGTTYLVYAAIAASDGVVTAASDVSDPTEVTVKEKITTASLVTTADGETKFDETVTYTGTDITPFILVKNGSSERIAATEYEVSYSNVLAKDKSTASGNHKDAGVVTVTITFKDTSIYTSDEAITAGTFTIAPKEVTVVADSVDDKTFDGNEDVTVKGHILESDICGSDNVTITELKGKLAGANVAANIRLASITSGKLAGDDAANYSITNLATTANTNNVKGNITAAEAVTFTGPTDITIAVGQTIDLALDSSKYEVKNNVNADMKYTLSNADVLASFLTLAEDGKLTCTAYTDFSNITVTVELANPDEENYTTSDDDKKVINITIAKQQPIITFGNADAEGRIGVETPENAAGTKDALGLTVKYNATGLDNDKSGTVADGNIKIEYEGIGETTLTKTETAPTQGGTYKVTVTVDDTDANDNIEKATKTATLTIGKKVTKAPEISATSTEFETTLDVTITQTDTKEIHYTLDGSEPTAESTKYTDKITLEESTVVKAIAIDGSNLASTVVTKEFTKTGSTKTKVTVSAESKTVVVGGTYTPTITVKDEAGTETVTGVDTSYVIQDAQQKEVTLVAALATAGTYTIVPSVVNTAKYTATTTTNGTLIVKSADDASKAIADAQEAQTKAEADKLQAETDLGTVTGERDDALAEVETQKGLVADETKAKNDALAEVETQKGLVADETKAKNDALAEVETQKGLVANETKAKNDALAEVETQKGLVANETKAKNDALAEVETQKGIVAAAQKAAEEAATKQKEAEAKAEAAAAATTTATTKVGDTVKIDGNTYKVTSVDKKTVSFSAVKKNATSAYIVSTVTINGVDYKVTSIAKNAFKGDTKLTSVTIPTSVKTIGESAFSGCTKLASIVIPKNVTSIGKQAFYKCSKLKKVTIKSSKITKIGSKAFTSIAKKATITVPSKKKTAYKKLLKTAKFTGTVK